MAVPEQSAWSVLSRYTRAKRDGFVGGICLLVIAVVCHRIPGLLVGFGVDALIGSSPPGTQPIHSFVLVGTVGVAVVVEAICRRYGTIIYESVALDVQSSLYVSLTSQLLAVPTRSIDRRDRGSLQQLLTDDIDDVGSLFSGVRLGVEYFGGLCVAFVILFWLSPALTAVLLVIPFGLVFLSRWYARLLAPRYDAVKEQLGRVHEHVQSSITGLAPIKANQATHSRRSSFETTAAAYTRSQWRTDRLRVAYNGLFWALGTTGIWVTFALGGYWILQPTSGTTVTPGTLVTFVMYAESFLEPTRRLAVDVVDAIEDGRAATRRIGEVLAIETVESGRSACSVAGELTLSSVSFAYESEPVVQNVSTTIPAGAFVGIVGETGAGKSTLAALIAGIYTPTAGSIDAKFSPDTPGQRSVGYVSQSPVLFPGTVAENVATNDSPDRAALKRATRKAGVHSMISELPAGYETVVGADGMALSTGQRRRLALARALYGDPELLVLDEVTSGLDSASANTITERLTALAGEHTVVVVAHRLATVRNGDRLLVMHDGRCVETGTHADLLSADGRYASLWRSDATDQLPVVDR
ncbi:ABC transporter ATP-binding protein [Halocatena halophila]|uniref:ABC transporter ATP-binding protein n=1 Tax=Halocatena halophila TaxID=2814576 RepID=UPI002ED023D1